MCFDNTNKKYSKKTIIVMIILFILLGIAITLLLVFLPKKDNKKEEDTFDVSGLYTSLVTATDKEVKKALSISDITSSDINNVIYTDNTLYIDYVYNTSNSVHLSFIYDESTSITTILDSVSTNKVLPTYKYDMEYVSRTIETNIDNEYKQLLNTTYSKTFNKVFGACDITSVNIFISGLVKNDDESITSVEEFKIKKENKEIKENGIKVDVNKSSTDKYYLLLNYLLTR